MHTVLQYVQSDHLILHGRFETKYLTMVSRSPGRSQSIGLVATNGSFARFEPAACALLACPSVLHSDTDSLSTRALRVRRIQKPRVLHVREVGTTPAQAVRAFVTPRSDGAILYQSMEQWIK